MQAAGYSVAAATELAAGVQDGHDHLNGGLALGGVDVHRNAAAVVRDLDAAVGLQDDFDVRAVSGQRLINGVVHHFVHQVVQSARPVEPMYMPGRFRTASRPSRTVMSLAPYSRGVAASAGVSGVGASSIAGSTAWISALSLATGALDSSLFDNGRPMPSPRERRPPTGTSLIAPTTRSTGGTVFRSLEKRAENGLSQRFTGAQLSTAILS